MAQTRKRQQGEEDFFQGYSDGLELKHKHQELQLKQRELRLKTMQGIAKLQGEQQRLSLDMLRAGVNPFTSQPMQRGAYNPITGDRQDTMYDTGANGGPSIVRPVGPAQLPAIRPDQLEVDPQGRTYINMPNGVKIPAVVELGPGGQVSKVRGYDPNGRERLFAMIMGDNEEGAAPSGGRSAPTTPKIENPVSWEEGLKLVDEALIRGVKLDTILSEIDKDAEILPGMKTKLKNEARARFGRRKRGTA